MAGVPDAEAPTGNDRRTRLALEAAGIGVWEYDVASQRLVWDERVRAVAEVDADVEPTFADHFLACVHPEDRSRIAEAFARLVAGGAGAQLSVRCRIAGLRTGRVLHAALEGRCVEEPPGRLAVIGTASDVTAEETLAEALRELNGTLEARVAAALAERQIWADMFEQADDPIAAVDANLRVIAMNSAYRASFERLFGRPLAIGDSLEAALAHLPQARDVSIGVWRRALAGETVDVPRSREAGERPAVYDIKFRPIRDRDGQVIGAFQYSRDVTQRVRASERLREAQDALHRAQKMDSLGKLTGGVAHDFNNLLQVIAGNLQLLEPAVRGRTDAERRIASALMAVDRGSKLAQQLLAFGRRSPLEPRVLNVGKLIAGMDDMLRRALGETVEIQTLVAQSLWRTQVDPAQIENAILNLALNARDAMDGAGRLTIEAANAVLDEAYAARHPEVAPGEYVVVSVSDTGSGIAPEILERVFEPFFTTKPEGRGTGLGLSMVYGLVKQSGGHLKIYSEVGEGTSVKVYLPRAVGAEDPAAAPAEGPAEGGHETVLVVEDDEAVRDTAVALLSDLGYQVLKAADATRALAVIESGIPIDLIFTDVVMPGPLRSPELARKAVERLPGVKVLFTSGYTENAIVHGGRLDPGVELLSKPYTREALARKVRAVLTGAAPAAEGEAAPAEALKVLLVDDLEDVRRAVADMLRGLGCEPIEAADAEAALERLETTPVDVLIADRRLPGLSGEELALRVRARRPDLPVVFASAEAAAVPERDLADAVFLVKPYDRNDLQRALEQVRARPTDAAAAPAAGRTLTAGRP